jgi:hypothetical protein
MVVAVVIGVRGLRQIRYRAPAGQTPRRDDSRLLEGQLREHPGPGEVAAEDRQALRGPGRPQPRYQPSCSLAGLLALIRRHWVFTLAAAEAVVPRVIAMLGFQPAVLFRLDTFDYLWGAVHLSPNAVNPSGYSVFLWLLRPLHSIVLVVALQHMMGLGVATMMYALLRRYGMPAWGATLAAAPVLFDPAQLLAEQFVMADLLAMTLMMAGLTVLLIRRSPSLPASAAAGLLLGASVTVRATALPLVVLVPAYLLIRGSGWRRSSGWLHGGTALAAGLVPVLAYMSWFAAANGSFNITNSNGLFLWSRTMSFADCAVIKPPADLRALCPDAQPGELAEPVISLRPQPLFYLWNHQAWQWQPPAPGSAPDTAAFTSARNERALRFAAKAIEAQPAAYLGVVARESLEPFIDTNDLRFPAYQPSTATLEPGDRQYAIGAVEAYTGTAQGVADDLGYQYGTRVQSPYATIMDEYQQDIFLPGPVFALIVLTGLAGCLLPRRRTAEAAFLWISAAILIILPTAEHEYTYRYVIPSIPLVCIAAALALRSPAKKTPAEQGNAPGSTGS